ncbi:hypothetical protein D4Z21_24855 [Salmonella enterica subsp. enterica]|nr:hypothetical protein [Salmonella enterica]ECI5468270.1 hypothetical protein [Salmonella enterica subsp. enterica]
MLLWHQRLLPEREKKQLYRHNCTYRLRKNGTSEWWQKECRERQKGRYRLRRRKTDCVGNQRT